MAPKHICSAIVRLWCFVLFCTEASGLILVMWFRSLFWLSQSEVHPDKLYGIPSHDLDLYTGSHQTRLCISISPKMHKDADISWYPAYRAVEWLICYPASPAEVSELLASNKIDLQQSRAHSHAIAIWCLNVRDLTTVMNIINILTQEVWATPDKF
jgi:hypothetical protein